MPIPYIGYHGPRRFFGPQSETPEEKIRRKEEKMDKERLGRRNKARDIISTMDDVKIADKSDREAFEKNQIDHMGDEENAAYKLIEKRVDKGEKILDQIEKEGGAEEIRGAIEILKQVINNAENRKETQDNPEATSALEEVIKDATENIKLREAFLDYYEKDKTEAKKIQNNQLIIESAEKDGKGIVSAREKIKETYAKKSNE